MDASNEPGSCKGEGLLGRLFSQKSLCRGVLMDKILWLIFCGELLVHSIVSFSYRGHSDCIA